MPKFNLSPHNKNKTAAIVLFMLLLLMCMLRFPFSVSAQTHDLLGNNVYRVLNCHDGDTCRLKSLHGSEELKVRLVGIDAPEIKSNKRNQNQRAPQPMGNEAREVLNQRIKGKDIALIRYGTDDYGRILGEIILNSKNINIEMIEMGLAEVYRGKIQPKFRLEEYKMAEAKARKERLGIWSQSDYESPKEFRKRNR